MNQSQLTITSHIQSYCDGGIASSHVTLTLGGLLKLNGLRGGERDAVTLPAGVAVGQCFFREKSDLYTF